jgi:S1-C subfamily serine protease
MLEMKSYVCLGVALLLVCAVSVSAAEVGPQLQQQSVNIKAGSSQGSGTIVLRSVGGEETAFVLTAAHVVDGLRKVDTVIVDGTEKKKVRYEDAQVVQEVPKSDNSRIVGDRRLDAKVISVDESRDIALLQVRAVGEFKTGAVFYPAGKPVPSAGTEILHCGAPGGQDTGGTATVTAGIISRTGVRKSRFGGAEHGIYDQTDTAAMGGSSGGMCCLRSTGEWVGMITLGIRGENFHWFVPIRNVRDWAEEVGCEWLLDPKAKQPTAEEVAGLPLEGQHGIGKSDGDTQGCQTLIWRESVKGLQ